MLHYLCRGIDLIVKGTHMLTARKIAERIGASVHKKLGVAALDWDSAYFEEEDRAVIHYCFTDDMPEHLVFVVERGVFVDGKPTFKICFGKVEELHNTYAGPIFPLSDEDSAVDYCVKKLREWVKTSDSDLAKNNRMAVAAYAVEEAHSLLSAAQDEHTEADEQIGEKKLQNS